MKLIHLNDPFFIQSFGGPPPHKSEPSQITSLLFGINILPHIHLRYSFKERFKNLISRIYSVYYENSIRSQMKSLLSDEY
jgi:hypothetical protein